MKIYIEKTKKTHKIEYNGTAKGLLTKLNINSESVIIAKNGSLITLDSELKDTDEIKVLSVISGG